MSGAARIGDLNVRLGIDTAQFMAGTRAVQSQLGTLGTAFKAFAASAAVNLLGQMGIAALKSAAQIGDLAETIGVTAEQIQVFNRLAVVSGTSADSMAKGLQSIAEQAVDAESKLSKLFAANNISAKGMAVNDVIRTFMDLLKNAKNPAEQLAIAVEVLGARVGRDLIEALRDGAQGYDRAMQDMIDSGTLMSNAEIKRLQDLETEYNKVADNIAAYWMKTVVTLSEAPSTFMKAREYVQKAIYGTTDAEIAAGNTRSQGPYPEGNTRGPLPVTVTNLPKDDGTTKKTGGSSKTAPSWMTGSSDSPSQGGDVTGFDLRGNGLAVDDFTDSLYEANNAAMDLAGSITDTLGYAISGLASGTLSFKEAFSDMARSLISDLSDITAQLLKSGLMSLLGGYGPSAFGAQGILGTGFGGFYASGGTLGAGKWGIAGENGPEAVKGPASIMPMGAGGGTTVNVYNQGGGDVQQRRRTGANGREFVDIIVGVSRQTTAKDSKKLLGGGFGLPPALTQR